MSDNKLVKTIITAPLTGLAAEIGWIYCEIKEQAKQNVTNTDYTFKLYKQAYPDQQITLP